MPEYTGATALSSVVNTVNTIIGSGILVLPYAIRTDGILLGVFVLLFAGILNGIGMVLQGASSKFLPRGSATFFTVCRITYPNLSVLFDLAIFLQCFGVNISYLVLTGDILPLVYTFDGWDTKSMSLFYILISTVLVVPLSLTKKLDNLRYTSIVALTSIVYICFLIYCNFIIAVSTDYKSIPQDKLGDFSLIKPQGFKPVCKTFGIIVLAYTCPTQFSIVGELRNPTMKRIAKITTISMTITAILFISVGLSGYLTFGNALEGNILLMYKNDIFTQTGRALLILMVILSFPLIFHPSRVSFNNIYHVMTKKWVDYQRKRTSSGTDDRSPLLPHLSSSFDSADYIVKMEDEDVPLSNLAFYTISFVLLLGNYTFAILLNSFELILAIVGSTGGVLISFILPGFYGYKLLASDDDEISNRLNKYSLEESDNPIFKSKLLKNVSLFLIIWGLIAMVICLYSSIFE